MITCFGFLRDKLKRDTWVTALNGVLEDSEVTKTWVRGSNIYQKDLKPTNKKSLDLLVHPPSVFKTIPSCFRQTVFANRQVSERKVDYDSQRDSVDKRRKDKD